MSESLPLGTEREYGPQAIARDENITAERVRRAVNGSDVIRAVSSRLRLRNPLWGKEHHRRRLGPLAPSRKKFLKAVRPPFASQSCHACHKHAPVRVFRSI